MSVSVYLPGFITAVALFRRRNVIPPCFSIDLVLNFLLSYLLVLFPSTFFLHVFCFFYRVISVTVLIPLQLVCHPDSIKNRNILKQ
jgi:hypothetical protein